MSPRTPRMIAVAVLCAAWLVTQNISKDQWQPGGTTWYVRNYLKGEFRYCPIRIGACIETDYPWIYLDLNGAGGYARTAGGY